jgi:nicotinic acid mononucleotide adenylyltransferase
MIERATVDIAEADHDYAFSNQLAHQYTLNNMLQSARRHYGDEHEFWFLVGSDIFEHMNRWEDVALQHEYGGFIVMLRDDHTRAWLDHKRTELVAVGMPTRVELIVNSNPHVSSRTIREAVKLDGLVGELAPEVCTYIKEHRLYLD